MEPNSAWRIYPNWFCDNCFEKHSLLLKNLKIRGHYKDGYVGCLCRCGEKATYNSPDLANYIERLGLWKNTQ